MEAILKQIGLTDSESKVYIALLEMGDSTRQNIVKRSGIAGSKVYEVLDKLYSKGLVAIYIKDKIKHFKAVNPNQIIHYLENKKLEINNAEKNASTIMPRLMSIYESSKEDQEVELLTGINGLEVIFREQTEILKKSETCYVIGGTRGSMEEPVVAFFQKMHMLREEKKIKTKMLYNIAQKKNIDKQFSRKKYPNTETRYIPHTSPVAINIYKNRVVIVTFGKEIVAVHMKSREIADSFMEYFNILWKQSKN